MADAERWRGLPTVAGFAARQALVALERAGAPVEAVASEAGLKRSDLEDAHIRLSALAQARFVELAAEALDDDVFGLHLAEGANPRQLGLLYYASASARTLEDSVALFLRYHRIANESVRFIYRRDAETATIETSYVGFPRRKARQVTEFQFAAAVKGFREITGRNFKLVSVSHSHPRNSGLRQFERYYGCPVEFAAPVDQLTVARENLALPALSQDKHLLETLRPFCEQAAKARATATGSLRETVENEIQRLLPHGEADAATVARGLAMSARTLSRRLQQEGASFADIVDRLRQSLARQYLAEPGFSLAHIAWLLGYEGVTSFHHAHKRWTGRSPAAVRREGAGSTAG